MTPYDATFLNDLTRDDEGNLYLSDSLSNFVARIEPAHEHRVVIVARGPRLAGANGLSIQPKTGRLAVVTWGTGQVLEVSKNGEVRPWLDRKFNKLDGADFDADGNLYFSAYAEGKVYREGLDGKVSIVRDGLITPADINIDRRKGLLLIPSFETDSVRGPPGEMTPAATKHAGLMKTSTAGNIYKLGPTLDRSTARSGTRTCDAPRERA